jgi:hypothetical protein
MRSSASWMLVGILATACGHPAATVDASADASALPGYAHEATLTAPMALTGANCGATIAMSGDGGILAITEWGVKVGSTYPVGAVHIFALGMTGWEEEARLQPSVGHAGDGFGNYLGLSTFGDTLVIGAPGDSSNAIGVDGVQRGDQRSLRRRAGTLG